MILDSVGCGKLMINRVRAALFLWYPFKAASKVLLVAEKEDGLRETLHQRIKELDVVSAKEIPKSGAYDYIICAYLPECERKPSEIIQMCRVCLKESGTFLFPMNNRIGIRYFCGDRDPYTNRVFDGVENYIHMNRNEQDAAGRMYTANEMKAFIEKAGFRKNRFYSVYSGLEYPLHIISEGYVPNEDLANRVIPMYHYPYTVFLEEETLYQTLAENGLFHKMANAYLVECGSDVSKFSDSRYITCSFERSNENSMITIIENNGTVVKRALFDEGKKRLSELKKNHERLNERGVRAVNIDVHGLEASMSYMEYPTVQKYLQKLLKDDKKRFLKELDRFIDEIDKSTIISGTDDIYGPIAAKAYMDMVPLNCLYVNGEYIFIDQEYVLENYPINIVKARVLLTFFSKHDELRFIEEELYERYGLLEKKLLYREKEHEFLRELWSEDQLGTYRSKLQRDIEITGQNRRRMNLFSDFRRRCFEDIFEGTRDKRVYLFGSGKYAEHFINHYGTEFEICGIFDNDSEKWGKNIGNISIISPEKIKSLERGFFKIIICMRDYKAVIDQLDECQVIDYSVYDMHKKYES